VLVLGVGGGGDVVGALSVARLAQDFGADFALGGVAWERMPIDPRPGPRSQEEILGGKPLSETSILADETTTTIDGVPFAESRMAGFLCSQTVLIDITRGVPGAARGVLSAARALGCDATAFVDVGGDMIAKGSEPELASPLCDAVMLAAAGRVAQELPTVAAVFGPGCDGELSAEEVMTRLQPIARRGGWIGTWGLTPAVADQIEAAARVVPTEASLQAVRAARGEVGTVEIRSGRRRVELGPAGALTLFLDVVIALEEAPLARAVAEAEDIEAAREALARRGIRTELDYERQRAIDA
jgi:hypothetical protein